MANSKKHRRLTWAEALEAYETHLRARRAAKLTIKGRLRHVGLLRDHLQPLRPDQVRLVDLREYQCGLLTGETSRSKRPLKAQTVVSMSTDVRCFFAWLAEEGLLKDDPAARLECPRVGRQAPGTVLSVAEVQRLFAAVGRAPGAGPLGEGTYSALALRDRAVVEVLYATALRRAELIALDLSDLDHTERELIVRAGKGEKGRVVPLTRSAYERVKRYLELGRPELQSGHPDSQRALFLNVRGKRFNTGGVRALLKHLARAAGLKKQLSTHTWRRTCASHLLQGGASLRHIQLLLGHASLNTTAVYLRLDRSDLRRELLLRHPRERFDA